MKTRFLLTGLAAMIVLPGLTISDANADHKRHWFFDSYSQYEDEAYTYYVPENRVRRRQPNTANRDPLRLYEEGYISEREYRRILRAERRQAKRLRARKLRAKQRKAAAQKKWRNREVRYDLAPKTFARKNNQLENVPLPRSRPLTDQFAARGSIDWQTETPTVEADTIETATLEQAPVIQDPVEVTPIKPSIAATPDPIKPETRKPAPIKKVKGRITCRSAEQIVAGFGFTDIEAKNCNGTSYDFAAQRDGKPFSIKLSSKNGELTEVKRN